MRRAGSVGRGLGRLGPFQEDRPALFVTGFTYADELPVTADAIQQSPAFESVQNGFVECFTADGSSLLYASYLTAAFGDVTPTAIAPPWITRRRGWGACDPPQS